MCVRAENCGSSAVAVPRRSCSSSCRCAVAVSHGPGLLDQEIPQLLDAVIDVPVVQDERDPHVPSWRRQSCSHGLHCRGFRLEELMRWVFRALHTGAGPGVVSTGTRPP